MSTAKYETRAYIVSDFTRSSTQLACAPPRAHGIHVGDPVVHHPASAVHRVARPALLVNRSKESLVVNVADLGV